MNLGLRWEYVTPVFAGARNGSALNVFTRVLRLPYYPGPLRAAINRQVAGGWGFRRPERHGKARCRNHRLERRQFRAAEAAGEVEQGASVYAEALNSQNPTGRLHSEVLARRLSVGRKLKMEIAVY
jgi:hypothetical protein